MRDPRGGCRLWTGGYFCGRTACPSGVPGHCAGAGRPDGGQGSCSQRVLEPRRARPNCNVQFGEGGAGTFSDGKLTTRIHDPLCRYVLERFGEHGAPAETLRRAKPHIGTDLLRGVVCSMREEIIRNGGEIRFNTCLTGLDIQNGQLKAVRSMAK